MADTAPASGWSGPVYVLDGSSLLFRAFFALPPDLATTAGVVTNAVLGFVNMLVMLMQNSAPSGIGVAWDRKEPTFRDEVVPEYKANRSEMPAPLAPQFDLTRNLLAALGIPNLDLAGYEADDILATLATRARDAGQDVVVVTGDRDAFQLVEDPHIKVLYTRRGLSDTVLYDEAGIEERTGVRPAKYPVLASLRGDPSDNLAGAAGVGEKTAAKLVNAYGDLDGIYTHLDELTPKLRENLAEAEERVRRNLQVIPLLRDAPVAAGMEDLAVGGWDIGAARAAFDQLELRAPWGRLEPVLLGGGAMSAPAVGAPRRAPVDLAAVTRVAPDPADPAVAVLERLAADGRPLAVVPVWAGAPGRSPITSLALAVAPTEGPIVAEAVVLEGEVLQDGDVRRELARLAGPGGPGLVVHGAKELMRAWLPAGIDIVNLRLDTAVAAYLLDPSIGRYRLEDVAELFLQLPLEPEAEHTADPAGQLALGGEPIDDDGGLSRARRAVAVATLATALNAALDEAGLRRLHDEVELPLVRVLARMEVAGVGVDRAELRRITDELAEECASLVGTIQDLAGEEFNVNSTPQLRAVLYDKLGLAPGKKTKTGYSTDAATLEKLRGQHPVVDALLRYREVEKLRSTYGETLLAEVAADDRIHASFNQVIARTGRLSSEQPNLHNIPVRTEEGRTLRRAFVPAPGSSLLVCDYDQIELRVIAHLSGDPGLVAAFEERHDIHAATASGIFGVAPEDVTIAQRSKAKMVSYGLAYGMEAYGLGQRLGIETGEAAEILAAYFIAFPAVRAFMTESVVQARHRGYTETLFGRRRPLPDLTSPNRNLRMAAERQAMNAGVQGLAADLFKVALVRLDRALEDGGFASRLVLQVHDEVLVEAPDAEREQMAELVPAALAGAGVEIGLTVPLEVSSAWGDSWGDAKG